MPDMKPSFALNLTEDGITLLHRTSRGWLDVGTVAFDDPDMGAALDYLRSTALGLSPKGITTKLIIPESQILYLEVEAAGPDDTSRRAQIEAALDGRTPYALDELAYDWMGDGPTVTVAVVARETLAEAEGFATEHRFNPLSFVANPERGFDKEPFFGPSALAPSLLTGGEQVEADAEPVTIIAREMSQAEAAIEGTAQGAASDKADPEVPEPEVPAPVTPAPELPDPVAPEPEVPAPDLPEPAQPEPEVPEPVTPEPEVPAPAPPAPADPIPAPPAPEVPEPYRPKTPVPETPVEIPAPEPAPAPPMPPVPAPPPEPMPVSDPIPQPYREPATPPSPLPPAFDPVRPRTTMASPVNVAAEDEAEAPMAVDVPQEDAGDEASAPVAARSAQDFAKAEPVKPDTRTPEMGKPDLSGSGADDLPPLSSAAMMAFSTRRPAEGAARPLGAAAPLAARPEIRPETGAARPAALSATRSVGASTGPAAGSGAGQAPAAKPLVDRPAAARPVPKFSYDDPLPPPSRMPGDPPSPPASVMNKASKGLRSLGNMVTAPSIPGTRKKKPVPNAAPQTATSGVKPAVVASTLAPVSTLAAPLDASPAKASISAAAQSLARQKTVSPDALAKGLSARGMPQRGKPRYLGLILTGILLLLLAIVAAWSSFYLTRSDDAADEMEVAGFEAGYDDEAIADGQMPGDEGALQANVQEPADLPVNVDLADLEPDTTEEALAEVAAPEVVVPDEVAADVPAGPAPQTGVQDVLAAATQPDPAAQDEIFLAGMDAPPALSDPLLLTAPAARGDSPPAEQMPPPPFGTVYQFDENGRIVPTAEGILTPEGVMLVAGKPARVPPPRPPAAQAALAPAETVVPAAESVTAAVTDAVAQAVTPEAGPAAADGALQPSETFAADPALSAARPRLRPAGLAPEAVSDDDASLAPAEDSRFASLRPRLRPQAILAAGESARQASEAASLAVNMAVAEAAVANADDASLSPLAVSVSRVPAPRPRDMSRAVEAAVAAATRRAEPEALASASTAAPAARSRVEADEADDEPEVASAAPRIPTKANVAKQATFANAINLGKINLIGVYGTQSKRYALVRQPNGRYRKVRVGDNIDGGRVQAITASEVRYQKGGRMLALSMPKG
ncbi:hypothetical protein D1012_13495 [Pseudotabrizicola alkalilacus]|uniref:Translation initiation factor 2 n=2 Tax=Pseudotabrizicola alkalilacus TaxID=2305252 RepID=A0A411Z0S3_9RHOB|nr:hypothetical protein D1012_13495 [Pseudotabrizicola alkalilacus]